MDGINLKHPFYQFLSRYADWNRELKLSFQNEPMEFVHIRSFERNSATEHCEEQNTKTPNIDEETLVALISYDLGSYVGRSATLLVNNGTSSDNLRYAEVTDLDDIIRVDKNIVELDVSVKNRARVDVSESVDNLFEYELGDWLSESSFPFDVLKQVSLACILHHHQEVLR